MTTSTRDCNFILSASEVGIPFTQPTPHVTCKEPAVASIGTTLYRCRGHYVDLLAAKPQIDMISYHIGVAIWNNMDVKLWG